MKPYYSHAGIRIYHGDARELVPIMMPETDVIVTDPPYGTDAYDWDKLPPDHLTGPRAIFGRLPEMLPLLQREPPELVVTWWPSNGDCIGQSRRGVHRQAHIIACWKFVGEVRKDRASDASLRLGWSRPALMADVWTDPHPHAGFNKSSYSHPTEKPVALMARTLRLMGYYDQQQAGRPSGPATVLDPYMGSGTTLVAAKQEGQHAIGIEIEERYCEIAAKRLAQGVLAFTEPHIARPPAVP